MEYEEESLKENKKLPTVCVAVRAWRVLGRRHGPEPRYRASLLRRERIHPVGVRLGRRREVPDDGVEVR